MTTTKLLVAAILLAAFTARAQVQTFLPGSDSGKVVTVTFSATPTFACPSVRLFPT